MFGNKKVKSKVVSGSYDTLLSGKTAIKGDVNFSGGLHIDGKVEGTVSAEGNDAVLRISEVGEVEGDVYAPHIIINGTVHGNVYASEHLELASKASIHGNVYYNLIQMAMGAAVNGSLLHRKDKESLGKQDEQPRLVGAAASEGDSPRMPFEDDSGEVESDLETDSGSSGRF